MIGDRSGSVETAAIRAEKEVASYSEIKIPRDLLRD
jgi:hypothetical protein